MNDNEREMDLALAEAEQENRLLRARNERLERELAGQAAINKMAENARELGLSYEGEIKTEVKEDDNGSFTITDAHSTADVVRWLLTQDTKETILCLIDEESQPAPVKTYHDGKPWPVAPKPWVGLSEEEVYEAAHYCVKSGQSVNETIRAIETKLKEKNT
jgi:hypothetical protein